MESKDRDNLLQALKTRFDKNPLRHKGVVWDKVQAKLQDDAKVTCPLLPYQSFGEGPG